MILLRREVVEWTHDALDHALAYPEAYGFEGSESERQGVAAERENIDQGRPSRRNPPATRVYLIEVDGEIRGEVVVSQLDEIPELGVAVYARHQGAGLAEEAITSVTLELHAEGYRIVEATIRLTNPGKDAIGRLLKRCDFTFYGRCGGVEIWRHEAQTDPPE